MISEIRGVGWGISADEEPSEMQQDEVPASSSSAQTSSNRGQEWLMKQNFDDL